MLIRVCIALATFASVAAQGQSCQNARPVSSAQLSEEGQAAGALYQKPACQRIHMPELRNVFIAQVTRIEDHDGELNLDGKCVRTLLQTVHMRVRKQIVGDAGETTVVSAGDLNGFYFNKGRVYLVYAERLKDGMLHVSGYGQTKLLSEASADLAYIRSDATRLSGSEIRGHAWQPVDANQIDYMVVKMKPVPNLRVTMHGIKSYEVMTGVDGAYKADGVAPGHYVVSIDTKSSVWPEASQVVDVFDKGCAEVDFRVDPFRARDGGLINPKP